MTTEALETRLKRRDASPANTGRTYLQWTLQMMILNLRLYATRRAGARRDDASTRFVFPAMSGRELADLLRRESEAMAHELHACRRKFGIERVGIHPLFGPSRVDQWRRYHALHGQPPLDRIAFLPMAQAAPYWFH